MSEDTLRGDQLLGEINLRIAGMQYVEGEAQSGESVYLERDFNNQHDPNTIRIKNLDYENVGFIPREVCLWLSPLWDEGQIFLEGRILPDSLPLPRERHQGLSLTLSVYLTPKGQHMGRTETGISSEVEAIQDLIHYTYGRLSTYANPALVEGMQERLKKLLQRDALPASHLLLSLFPHAYRQTQKHRNQERRQRIRGDIERLQALDGIHYRNLTLFPVMPLNGSSSHYELFSEALKAKTVEVEEVTDDGHVHEILLKNKAAKPVLLPEGEILIGAKQNRVINISILVAAQSQTRIPVSCVERGRWRYSSPHFEDVHYAHPKLRGKKLRSVQRNRAQTGEARSDQSEVWQEVDLKLSEMQACSPTDSLVDGFQSAEDSIQEYRTRLILPKGSAGVIVCSGDRVLGFDYFGKSEHFQASWEKLSQAYFAETCYNTKKAKKTDSEKAKNFLSDLVEGVELCEKPVGQGDEFMIQKENLTGTGVWYSDTLCHLAVFGVD